MTQLGNEFGEIRNSTITKLEDKVRKQDYGQYLYKVSIHKIRGFIGEDITFDFPVTALVGPNGSGKSSVMGTAGCAYKVIKPSLFFPKSVIGDESMSGWRAEYEMIDRRLSQRQSIRRSSSFRRSKWVRGDVIDRPVLFFGIERTVPAGEKPKYKKLIRSTYKYKGSITALGTPIAKQVEHILGKQVIDFKVADLGHEGDFFVGKTGNSSYSEFHFGAGESSIIRMVSGIESAPEGSLILIEEIENGLHPVAARRMVEYLIDVAERKKVQVIFTTHSDYALQPLPDIAIWACIDGRLRQGKLSIESLRAISGRVDKKLAIFVEDEFAKCWVDCILREYAGTTYDQVELHALSGDGNAVSTHRHHGRNPAMRFRSMCVIDGDSKQQESIEESILRLPGDQPELTIFSSVKDALDQELAILTVSCHRQPGSQDMVRKAIEKVSALNRDPHTIFNSLGIEIGFVPESIVRSAFLSIWARRNEEYCQKFARTVQELINSQGRQ
ncbi:ATP-dependent nuclease [Pseudomonas aeruginosa]|uniref:ATP-dependent nuclease n=1 Tax=Pseudomonas aeruginosa TaxID=287 RepID=UPI003F5241C0